MCGYDIYQQGYQGYQHPHDPSIRCSPYPITFLHYDMYFSQSNPFQMLDFTVKSNYKKMLAFHEFLKMH